MRNAVVGVGRLRMDPSPLGLVIATAPPYLIVLGVAHYWSDVWIQALLDNTGMQPIDCQKDRSVHPR